MKKSILALLFALALVLTACGTAANTASEAASKAAETASEVASTAAETASEAVEAVSEKASEAVEAVAGTDVPEKLEPAVTLKFGVSPVPHAEIAEAIKAQLAERGVNLEIITFDDYVIPNNALASGEIDANFFQHVPYFEEFTTKNNLDLKVLGSVHIEPMGVYSAKYKSLDEVPNGGKVLIPNDVSNGARALLLLEKNGLIKLDDPTNINVTEANITENPKNLTFVPLEAAAVGRTYQDGDLAIINSNYALEAGLNPVNDSLAIEDADSPYANIVAVRNGEENEPQYQILLQELNSDTVKKLIEEKYAGAVVPAFSLEK